MNLLLRHKLLAAGAALVAAGSAGIAYAATQSSSNPRQAFLNDVAKRLHVSPAQLDSAWKAAMIDRLNADVKAGRLTQAQANRLEQRLERRGGPPVWFGPHGRFGLRVGGPLHAGALDAAGKYLGLSDLALLRDLASGKSLAQLAKAQGKSVSGLEQAIVSADKARLDRLVASGIITSAQEQQLASALTRRVGRVVNRAGLPRLGAGGPGRWPMQQVPMPQDGSMIAPPAGAVPPPGAMPPPGVPGPSSTE